MTPPYGGRGHGGAQEARDFTPRWMKVYTKMASEFTPRWTSLPQDTLPILIAPPARRRRNNIFLLPFYAFWIWREGSTFGYPNILPAVDAGRGSQPKKCP